MEIRFSNRDGIATLIAVGSYRSRRRGCTQLYRCHQQPCFARREGSRCAAGLRAALSVAEELARPSRSRNWVTAHSMSRVRIRRAGGLGPRCAAWDSAVVREEAMTFSIIMAP